MTGLEPFLTPEMLKVIVTQGIFCILFVWYAFKDKKEKEKMFNEFIEKFKRDERK
jgi:hypothetical protein